MYNIHFINKAYALIKSSTSKLPKKWYTYMVCRWTLTAISMMIPYTYSPKIHYHMRMVFQENCKVVYGIILQYIQYIVCSWSHTERALGISDWFSQGFQASGLLGFCTFGLLVFQTYGLFGYRIRLDFPTCRLLDFWAFGIWTFGFVDFNALPVIVEANRKNIGIKVPNFESSMEPYHLCTSMCRLSLWAGENSN